MSVYAIGEHHLTEEELAQSKFDFDLEDVLYIRLDPLEARLQQLQDRRILDNQYLFSLSPAGRRWYELMAAKIFGVVHNKGAFCEIRYSWYTQHHHTLKRYFEHKRVRFQMDRVIRDHLESGYISRAEYRAVKEPDQEIDYIIRYYPGPAAGESIERIQSYIRKKRSARKLTIPPFLHNHEGQKQENEPRKRSTPRIALSVITMEHTEVIAQFIIQFGISLAKAYELALSRKDSAVIQLEAWPYREAKPRNPAGWMIQAIENNYDVPASYLDQKARQIQDERQQHQHDAVSNCMLCDAAGFRYIKNEQYPNGAMRQCTHDPAIEGRISADAQNGSESSEKLLNEKKAA